MTILWFLNPWREVRRLHFLHSEGALAIDRWIVLWRKAFAERHALETENAELKRKLGELHAYASCLEGKGVLCGCQQCTDTRPELPGPGKPGWRYACEKCSNKRCPHHDWHGFKCTGSNEPGQVGEEG